MDELFQTNTFHDPLVQGYHPHMKEKELFSDSLDLLILASAPVTSYSSWSLIFGSWFDFLVQKEEVGNRAVFHLWSGSLNLKPRLFGNLNVTWNAHSSYRQFWGASRRCHHPVRYFLFTRCFCSSERDNSFWQKDLKLKYRSPQGLNVSEQFPSMEF